MAEIVRIALNEPGPLRWPQRCPRCGSPDELLFVEVAVVRNNRGPQNRRPLWQSLFRIGVIEHVQESVQFPVLMCARHAQANVSGSVLLGFGLAMKLARFAIWFGLANVIGFVFHAIRFDFGLREALHAAPWPLLVWYAASLFGVASLAWARQVTWVRPIRLDPDYDIAIMRFKDAKYAREFKRLNTRHTMGAAVSTLPLWMRGSSPVMQVLVVALMVVLVRFWIHR